MSVYLDTSLIVAALVPEVRSDDVHSWLLEQADGSLFVSDWSVTEVAALSMKVRTGQLTLSQRAEVQAVWTAMRNENLATLPITPSMFGHAAQFIDRAPGLRAGDALHLAVAADSGCTFATLDELQAKAAPLCGVHVEKVR